MTITKIKNEILQSFQQRQTQLCLKLRLYSAGDRLLLYDTETNIEWLNASVVSDMTLQNFQNGASGLRGLGFNTATDEDIQKLLENAGVNIITSVSDGNDVLTENNFSAFNLLDDLLQYRGTDGHVSFDLVSTDYVFETHTYYQFYVMGSKASVSMISALSLHPE